MAADDPVQGLKKTVQLSRLYDAYGSLLTSRQRLYFENYYWHDLSLGEIAENQDVSRQAVHDQLRRVEAALNQYEEALHLAEQRELRRQLRGQLESELDQIRQRTVDSELAQIVERARKLLKRLDGLG